MKDLLLALAVLVLAAGIAPAAAQTSDESFAVLVFSRTAGFRHVSIPEGIEAIRSLGAENNFEVEATEDPAAFDDDTLARFAVVVFLNTTGDVLERDQQAAFERYMAAGGSWVGIHSAADTEYEWGFYGKLLGGAYFKNHPVQQPGVIVNEAPDHPSTAHLPERWQLPLEEFYSFRRNPRPNVRVLLNIDESTYAQDPNTSNLPSEETFPEFPEGETGTMGDHPMSWCHEIAGGRAWYTALGHENYLYRTPDYRAHILGGILTAAGRLEADCRPRTAAAPGSSPPATEPPPSDAAPGGGTAGPSLPATGSSLTILAFALLTVGLLTRRWVAGRRA